MAGPPLTDFKRALDFLVESAVMTKSDSQASFFSGKLFFQASFFPVDIFLSGNWIPSGSWISSRNKFPVEVGFPVENLIFSGSRIPT